MPGRTAIPAALEGPPDLLSDLDYATFSVCYPAQTVVARALLGAFRMTRAQQAPP